MNIEDLDKRLKVLEQKLTTQKTPRKKSKYNEFVQKYISEQRAKPENTKKVQELMSEAAKAWNNCKN